MSRNDLTRKKTIFPLRILNVERQTKVKHQTNAKRNKEKRNENRNKEKRKENRKESRKENVTSNGKQKPSRVDGGWGNDSERCLPVSNVHT